MQLKIVLPRNFQSQFRKDVTSEIKKLLASKIGQIERTFNDKIEQILFRSFIVNVPRITGREYHEIGVPDINERIMGIVRVASQNFRVKVKLRKTYLMNISINILDNSYEELLSLPEAVFTYTGRNSSGVLDWLRWLLLEGTNPVVTNHVYIDRMSSASRTGRGIFVNSFSNWSVPGSIAGTQEDNFLTRALVDIDRELEMLTKRELLRILR